MFPTEVQQIRLAPKSTLAWASALYLALNCFVIFVLFPSGALKILSRPTAGLVSPTLLANALLLAVVVGFLRWRGGLRADDLGLRRTGLVSALGVTLSVWLGVNLLQVAWALVTHAPLNTSPDWYTFGAPHTLGVFFGQLLGNALFEEILFRGVLFQQIRLHLLQRGNRPATALVLGVVISQSIFAFIHIPLRLSSGMELTALSGELALLFTLGSLLALLYWRTANLYVVIGVHALSNTPCLLVEQQIDLSTNGVIAAAASLVVMLLWPNNSFKPKPLRGSA